MKTWGCFSCRNPRIAFRVRRCPVCNKPRLNRRFGVCVGDEGYFLCSLESANLVLTLTALPVSGRWVGNGRERHIPMQNSDQEQDWAYLSAEAIRTHFQAKLEAASAPPAAASPRPPAMSLFEQVMQNARKAQQNCSPRHAPSPEKGLSPKPIANAFRQRAGVGFRYLQQMRHEQYAVKKLVQAVIDRRTHVDNPNESVDLDLPQRGEKRVPCPLCEHHFPESQLLGRVTLQAILRWKSSHGLSQDSIDEHSSSYHRAFSVIRRQNAVALCLFCTQFFGSDLGDSLEVESIKSQMGLSTYLKGPLRRPNGYYKSHRSNLIRQASLPLSVMPSTPSSPSTSSAVAQSSGSEADRIRARMKFRMDLEHLRSRSTQRITSLAQAKHMANKYFNLDAAKAIIEGQKARNKEACCIERRYYPIVQLPKKTRALSSSSAGVNRKPLPAGRRRSMLQVQPAPSTPDALDEQKARELAEAEMTLKERVARMRPTRSLSPCRVTGRRNKSTTRFRPAASLSPQRIRQARRQAVKTFPKYASQTDRGVRRGMAQALKKTVQASRTAGAVPLRSAPPSSTTKGSSPVKRQGKTADPPHAKEKTTASVDGSQPVSAPQDLLKPMPSAEPRLPATARKPLLFAIRGKAQPTNYSTVAVGGLKMVTQDPMASKATLIPKPVLAADSTCIESIDKPVASPQPSGGEGPAPASHSPGEEEAATLPAKKILRGSNKFRQIRSQQLAQAKQQKELAQQSATPSSASSVATQVPQASPQEGSVQATTSSAVVSPVYSVSTKPIPMEHSSSLPSIASEETSSTDRPETREDDTPRARSVKPAPPLAPLEVFGESGQRILGSTSKSSKRRTTRSFLSGKPGLIELVSPSDQAESLAEDVVSEPLNTAYLEDFEDPDLDAEIFGEEQTGGGARHSSSRAALRSVGSTRGDDIFNGEASLSASMERMKLLSRGADLKGDYASRVLQSPTGKQRGHSQPEVRKMQLL